MTGPLLEVRDLTVRLDGRDLISAVSLSIAPGAVHALVGPNGAGKSTLLGAILGFIEFTGTIKLRFRGEGRIGYVPQRFAVDKTLPLTAGEFLALSRTRRPACFGIGRKSRARAEELLSRVGLAGFSPRPLNTLSGGELQRVLLANAMDPVPELLIFDEPATGLDEVAVRRFEEALLGARKATGAAALIVSHDLSQVRRLADQVTVLSGRVVRSGPPSVVLEGDLAASILGAAT